MRKATVFLIFLIVFLFYEIKPEPPTTEVAGFSGSPDLSHTTKSCT